MPKVEDVNVSSLILDGLKELRGDIKELRGEVREDIRELRVDFKNVTEVLAEHSERITSCETSQEAYYRYNRTHSSPSDKDGEDSKLPQKRSAVSVDLSALTTADIVKLVLAGITIIGGIVGGILSQINF